MRGAFYSFLGLYQRDNTIFDLFVLPSQIEEQRENIINRLLFEVAEIDALYDDPETLKNAIGYWSNTRLQSWQSIANALYKNYNPFVNFTRDEKRETVVTPDGDKTSTVKQAGFNETQLITNQILTEDDNKKITSVDTFHSEGDSALFTPTDIARKETELRAEYDIINFIINEFKNKFCLLVY